MKKTAAWLLVVSLLILAAAGCSDNGAEKESSTDGKHSMTIAITADVGTFDPYVASQDQEFFITRNMYDSLTWRAAGEAEPMPRIAKEYSVSDDGLEYSFTLRDDVYFHNGEKMTTEDVLYSIECFRTAPVTMSFSSSIADVQAQDDTHLTITLLAPSGAFFENLNWLAIVPKAVHESAGDEFGSNPVGSGPYMLKSQTPGVEFSVEAFDKYYLGQPQITDFTCKVIPDQSTISMALQAGEVDYTKSIPFTAIPEIEQSEKAEYGVRTTYSTIFIFLNTGKEPYDNVKVRQAFNMAMDKEMCNMVMYEGYGTTATGMLSPSVFGYSDNIKGYEYDMEGAAELLAQAGYPDGQGFPAVTIESIDTFSRVAEAAQAGLRGLGIDTQVQIQEQNAYVSRALQGDVDVGVLGIGLGGDASSWGVMFKSGGDFNLARYSNSEFDALFDEAGVEHDGEKRAQLYEEAFGMLDEQAAWVPLLYLSLCHGWNQAFDVDEALRIGDNNLLAFYVTLSE